MRLVEQFLESLKERDSQKIADLFTNDAVFHDSSYLKVGKNSLHVIGKMGIEMIFHNRLNMNPTEYIVSSIKVNDDNGAFAFITHNNQICAVNVLINKVKDGKIERINIYPL